MKETFVAEILRNFDKKTKEKFERSLYKKQIKK